MIIRECNVRCFISGGILYNTKSDLNRIEERALNIFECTEFSKVH